MPLLQRPTRLHPDTTRMSRIRHCVFISGNTIGPVLAEILESVMTAHPVVRTTWNGSAQELEEAWWRPGCPVATRPCCELRSA